MPKFPLKFPFVLTVAGDDISNPWSACNVVVCPVAKAFNRLMGKGYQCYAYLGHTYVSDDCGTFLWIIHHPKELIDFIREFDKRNLAVTAEDTIFEFPETLLAGQPTVVPWVKDQSQIQKD